MENILRKMYHHDISDTSNNNPITICTRKLAFWIMGNNDKSWVTSILSCPLFFPLISQHIRHADRLETVQRHAYQMHLALGKHFLTTPHGLKQGDAAAADIPDLRR